MDSETFELYIERGVFGGDGMGRHEGKVVFVPGALPGERHRVAPVTEKKQFIRAQSRAIEHASPFRITPECPVYEECGGCSYLHFHYEEESTIKTDILKDSLHRIAKIPADTLPEITVHRRDRCNYRSHATFHSDGKKTGFLAKSSHRLVPLPEKGCLLLHHALNDGVANGGIRQGYAAVDANNHVIWEEESVIHERDGGYEFMRDINTFYQANRYLRDILQRTVVSWVEDGPVADIASGIGFFSIPVAVEKEVPVTGIDISLDNIRWAEKNAVLNKAASVRFIRGSMERVTALDSFSTVITDPPRAGLSEDTRKGIAARKPARIISVSCDPATGARDVRYFMQEGYGIRAVYLFDMFPGTWHIESLLILDRL